MRMILQQDVEDQEDGADQGVDHLEGGRRLSSGARHGPAAKDGFTSLYTLHFMRMT
jgi:hypothetical protein